MVANYLNVYTHLRSRIESGEFPVGTKIPGISDLELEYGVSMTPIRAAQQMLVDEGMLSVEQGRGAYVISTEKLRESDATAGGVALGIRFVLSDDGQNYVGALFREDITAAAVPRVGERLAPGALEFEVQNLVGLAPVVTGVDHYLHIPGAKHWKPLAMVVVEIHGDESLRPALVEALPQLEADGWSVTLSR